MSAHQRCETQTCVRTGQGLLSHEGSAWQLAILGRAPFLELWELQPLREPRVFSLRLTKLRGHSKLPELSNSPLTSRGKYSLQEPSFRHELKLETNTEMPPKDKVGNETSATGWKLLLPPILSEGREGKSQKRGWDKSEKPTLPPSPTPTQQRTTCPEEFFPKVSDPQMPN